MDTWYRIDQLMEPTGVEPYWLPLLHDPLSPAFANRYEDEGKARESLGYLRQQGRPVRLVRVTSEVIDDGGRP